MDSFSTILEADFLGLQRDYSTTLSLMHGLHHEVASLKRPNQLMLLEHDPTITITRQHMFKSVKTSEDEIKKHGIDLFVADRGGDVTFHGPGQLVGYPLIQVRRNTADEGEPKIDIETFIRSLEQALLMAVQNLGSTSVTTLKGFTGIWSKVSGKNGRPSLKKLVAIGVGIKDGVSKHGFAMNVDIDYERYSRHIIPCGLKDRGVITLKELFYLESLPMPSYSVIVTTVSLCLAQAFSLTLKWRSDGPIH